MVTIVDLQSGNIGSVRNMLHRLEVDSMITNCPDAVLSADRIIIPGVGMFNKSIQNLDAFKGLRSALKRAARDNRVPILGICIGMQILMDSSEEGEGRGLGLIKGRVRKLNAPELKIPHMGWNSVKIRKGNRLFDKLEAENRFYFVHSFAADTESKDDVLAETTYGKKFCSAIERHNVYGVQFHPEKSHRFGMQLLKNFCEIPHAV